MRNLCRFLFLSFIPLLRALAANALRELSGRSIACRMHTEPHHGWSSFERIVSRPITGIPESTSCTPSIFCACIQSGGTVRSSARHLLPAAMDVSLRQRSPTKFAAGECSNLNFYLQINGAETNNYPPTHYDVSSIADRP